MVENNCKIAFVARQFSLRGTEVALYDYAYYNREILNNQSMIFIKKKSYRNAAVERKFRTMFEVVEYRNKDELSAIAAQKKVDITYHIKAGKNDGMLVGSTRNVVHAVFQHYEPHGEVYAYISPWLSEKMTGSKVPYVPHMITLPAPEKTLREQLNIPNDAIVIGRYGGDTTFDIDFVKEEICEKRNEYKNLYFLFMGTRKFTSSIKRLLSFENKNIRFINASANLIDKSNFINTCDAMLHSRRQGESFGLAIGEFAYLQKPILCYRSDEVPDRAHYDFLGDDAIYFSGKCELREILDAIADKKLGLPLCARYQREMNPDAVMAKFKEVFIDEIKA